MSSHVSGRILTFSVRQLGLVFHDVFACVLFAMEAEVFCGVHGDRAVISSLTVFVCGVNSLPFFIATKAPLFVDPAVCRGGHDVSLAFWGYKNDLV